MLPQYRDTIVWSEATPLKDEFVRAYEFPIFNAHMCGVSMFANYSGALALGVSSRLRHLSLTSCAVVTPLSPFHPQAPGPPFWTLAPFASLFPPNCSR